MLPLLGAINAKNSMQNHHGFSPIQLVLGKSPNLPSVLVNDPPPLEDAEVSDTVIKHLNALQAAKRAFTKAESSERIRRALRHNVRVSEVMFQPGERVFYKRDDSNRWRGPGKVIGQDGKVVFIRHGSQLVRVATCRIIKTNNHVNGLDKQCAETKDEGDKQNEVTTKDNMIKDVIDRGMDLYDLDTVEYDQPDHEEIVNPLGENEASENNLQPSQEHQNNNEEHEVQQRRKQSIQIPAVKSKIKYRLQGEDEWTEAEVLGRGGKATGKNKFYVNVLNDQDKQKVGIHLDQLDFAVIDGEDSETEENNTNSEEANVVFIPANHHGNPEVIKAKEKELANWSDFEVYKEVHDHGQQTLSTRWVVTEKTLPNGEKGVKARLVVRGFEEDQQVPSDSPTASKSTLRLVLAIAASEQWKCESIHIKAAFLQGRKIDREVYLIPPQEIRQDGILRKLDKAVYGLDDASRNWFLSVKEEFLKLDCKQSQLDKALFRWYNNGRLEGVFVMHVDDFLFAGSDAFNRNVIDRMVNTYKIGRRQMESFRYVGLNISQCESGIRVNQEEYVAKWKKYLSLTRENLISHHR